MKQITQFAYTLATASLILTIAPAAYAYTGPGAGLTAIGSMLALVAAILLAIVGFVWYPLKRLVTSLSGDKKSAPRQPNS